MKVIFLTWIAFVSAVAQARSYCYKPKNNPNVTEVGITYLHGLKYPNSLPGDEPSNLSFLQSLADATGKMIAAPESPHQRATGELDWDPYGPADIDQFASEACGGAPLADNRTLIGYSNGAYKARDISKANCDSISSISKIISVGTPDPSRGNCPGVEYVYLRDHESLQNYGQTIREKVLSAAGENSHKQVVSAVPRPSGGKNSSPTQVASANTEPKLPLMTARQTPKNGFAARAPTQAPSPTHKNYDSACAGGPNCSSVSLGLRHEAAK